MPSTKYIARRAGLFASLMQATELGGFLLEPLAQASLRDVYFDTLAGDLLRQGYSLRVRDQGGHTQAQLRALRAPAGARAREADAALNASVVGDEMPDLPAGPLREMLELLAGDAPLRALLRLRQDRSPRVVYDGARLVGVISLDVVGYELPDRLHVANEIEIELAGTGREADLYRMDPVLRASGLEATSRSKFERGVLRLQRSAGDPVLLLPDERSSLEAMLEAPDPALRRRSRVVLLAARGLSEELVSARAGLSPARVRHWVDRFRFGRLAALREADVASPDFTPPITEAPLFRVSEIVSRGVPTSAVYRAEHFDPLGDPGFTIERTRESSDGAPADPRGDGAAGDGAAGPPPREVTFLDPELPEGPALTFIPVEPVPGVYEQEVDDGDEGAAYEVPVAAFAPGPSEPDEPSVAEPVATDPASDLEVDAPAVLPDEEEATVPAAEAPLPVADAPAHSSGGNGGASPARPRTPSDMPVLHAAALVLGYQHACFESAVADLLDAGAPAAARRALLAAHRVRLSLETFGDFLPERPVAQLHERLRGVARALDVLVDHDDALRHLAQEVESAPESAWPAREAGRAKLESRREAARRRAVTRLSATRHHQWSRRMRRLVSMLDARRTAGDVEAGFFRQPPDDYLRRGTARPSRVLLRHVLASTVWRRYEAVRAYDAVMPSTDAGRLRPLGVGCAALGFVLGIGAEAAPGPARDASRDLGTLEALLGDLYRSARSAELTGAPPPAGDAAAVAAAWERVTSPAFRDTLARVTAAI